jgi:hypothetical protein
VHGIWAAVVAGLFSILATALVIWFGQANGVVPSPVAASTVTAPATTVTETATATVEATPSSDPTESDQSAITYLDALDPVEDSFLVHEPATLGGVDYVHSLTNPMASCSQAGPVTWVLPSPSQRLLGEVGVDVGAAEPRARVAFLVQADGAEIFSEVLAVGEHASLDASVTEGERLTIETRFIPEGGFRGNCNTEATAVWGDLRLVGE